MPTRRKPAPTDAHKAAMQQGREQARAITSYLEALDAGRPGPGRRRTPESIERRLSAIDTALQDAAPLQRLQLIQERIDLLAEREQLTNTVDVSEFEAEFVGHAKAFSERKGITYAAWRAVGVSPMVLQRAGISRSS